MLTFLTVLHVFVCILLVLVVLIQSGKGAEISASFGGSSQTVFGSSGGANFFTRFTAGCAIVFMLTSIGLTLKGSNSQKSVFEGAPVEKSAAPANPAGASADAAKKEEAPKPAAPAAKK